MSPLAAAEAARRPFRPRAGRQRRQRRPRRAARARGPFASALDAARATAEPAYVEAALRAIPASDVAAMRATIHARAGAFRYSDGRGDAVRVPLRGILSAA